MTAVHRLIYQKHFGPIPVDEFGRTYDVHHLDGNRKNNDPSNLKVVSLQEHYDIHFKQGDWMACQRILKRMNNDPIQKSALLSKANKKRVADGTHNFLVSEKRKLIDEGRSATWEITFPDGTVVVRKNLKSFCVENGLNQGAMNQIALGRINYYKGFKCKKLEEPKIMCKKTKETK